MSGFGHIAKMKIDAQVTKELVLDQIVTPDDAGPLTLIGVFAGKSNKAFTNAVVRRDSLRAKMRKAKNQSYDTIQEARKDDEEIFAQHIITGWKNVFFESGKPAKFTPENVATLLAAFPDDVFDEVREFFCDPESFRDSDTLTSADAEELGNG